MPNLVMSSNLIKAIEVTTSMILVCRYYDDLNTANTSNICVCYIDDFGTNKL